MEEQAGGSADERTRERVQTIPAASKDSAVLLGALGIVAYAASMMTHEALGHGGYCLAAGGHTTMLTVWRETCELPGAAELGIKAAGPGVQFAAGLTAWVLVRLLSGRSSTGANRPRFFLWLFMAFDLLVSSGYVAFSGVTNFGDAAELVAGLQPLVVWRGGLVIVGATVYLLSMLAAALELKRFAGGEDRGGRLFRLVWIPYVAAGVFACCTGALNHTMGRESALGMAVASSFGAGLGMLFLPQMQRGIALKRSSPASPAPTIYLQWSAAWGVFAAVVIAALLIFIGPGLE